MLKWPYYFYKGYYILSDPKYYESSGEVKQSDIIRMQR
jgi:hypothetical protein